jgi:hypothetical protein
MKFEVRNRFTGEVQFAAEIECSEGTASSIKLGLAVKWAIEAGANLAGANLADANLARANLAGAYLARANLARANLAGAKGTDLAIAQTRILPDGDLVVWKKCADGVLVKLRIPSYAKRSHAFGRKCRAEFADCIEVIGAESGVSQHDEKTVYKAGERVVCDAWDADWTKECSGGIHFFITRAEAEAW